MHFNNPLTTKRQRVEQLENTNMVDEDMISKLPDDLIVHILSFLPTEDTIPTGVLSKRWANMWKKVQNLSFIDRTNKNGFEDKVTSALISYTNPFFSSLTISVSHQCDPMDLATWLGIAFVKKVSKLVLRLNKLNEPVMFPDSLLRRTNPLKIIKLMGNIILNLMFVEVHLACLKELHLYNVRFENEASVTRLLDGCPVLEDLVLDINISSGVEIFIIHGPTLLRLTVATYNCEGEYFVIKTPRLKYLNIRNLDGVDSCIMENAPYLENATIFRHYENLDENILSSITTVQCLSLSAPLKTPDNTGFHSLVTLEIDTLPDEWCNLMSYMLRCSPNLQILKLIGGRFLRWSTSWTEPQSVARCLLTKLHTIQWEDYVWDGEDDLQVAIYLLKNAGKLEKATFTTLKPKTNAGQRRRQEILTQLTNQERGSPLCHLVMKESSTWRQTASNKADPDSEDFTF